MKNMVCIITLVGLLFTACKSPEEKANVLIEEYVKSNLVKPDTYEVASTKIDSIFTPVALPDFQKKLSQIVEIDATLNDTQDEIMSVEEKKSSEELDMSIHSSCFGDYDRYRYNTAKEKRDKYDKELLELVEKKNSIEEKSHKLYMELFEEYKKRPGFVGYMAQHTYRAKNNAGDTRMGQMLFFLNKDLTQILYAIDMDSEEFEVRTLILKKLAEDLQQEK